MGTDYLLPDEKPVEMVRENEPLLATANAVHALAN